MLKRLAPSVLQCAVSPLTTANLIVLFLQVLYKVELGIINL